MKIQLIKTITIKSKFDVERVLNYIVKREDPELLLKEHAWGIGLDDTGEQVVYVDLISLGTLNYNLVHPREVFKPAIVAGCNKIIFAHNHPSGSAEASPEDIGLNKRLKACGEMLGIELVNAVILVGGKAVHLFEGSR